MNWLKYLLEANVYMAVFYSCYWLLLRNQTFYTANRVYLVATTLLSFAVPVVQIGYLHGQADYSQTVTTIIYNPNITHGPTIWSFSVNNVLIWVYGATALAFTAAFLFKLASLFKLAYSGKRTETSQYTLVELGAQQTAFSFFSYLFVDNKQGLSPVILKHELVHIRQRHSFDIVFFELLKIFCWFNPVVYLSQRSIKELHEFIADEQTAIAGTDTESYSMFLVQNAYGLQGSALANSFFNKNLLKIRIMKLYQKPSGKVARLRYLVALPVCAGLLCASTLAFSKNYALVDLAPQQQDTITQIKIQPSVKEVRLAPPPPPVELRLKPTKEKVGKVPPPPPPTQISRVKNKSTKTLPPPPPLPPTKVQEARNVAYASVKNGSNKTSPKAVEVVIEEPVPNPNYQINLPSSDMMKYIAKHTRYPAKSRENNTYGSVIAQFTLGSDNKVSNVKVLQSLDGEIDGEVVRVLNGYQGNGTMDAGIYCVAVDFVIEDKKTGKKYGTGPDVSLTNGKTYIGEVVVVSYK